VELAQDTQSSTLVYYTAALPPPTGVTRALPPRADVGYRTGGRGRLADGQVLFARRRLGLFARASGGDGHWHWAWHSRLYSHGSRHIGVGHGQCAQEIRTVMVRGQALLIDNGPLASLRSAGAGGERGRGRGIESKIGVQHQSHDVGLR
jgi:hypothetical protein